MEFSTKSQTGFNLLPAVVVGGPPHSGKSVLCYSLTQALRQRDVPHYLLRAYPPDGEGDWFLESEPGTVRHLRIKGASGETWLPLLRRDVARRHLPLIVDMGGLPTPQQEAVLDDCTHAVLLTPDEHSRQDWAARFARHGLVLLADLRSDLHGQNQLTAQAPLLQGVLAGLERRQRAQGPPFTALVERLADLFTRAAHGLPHHHLQTAPVENAVDLDRLAHTLGVALEGKKHTWAPHHLPAVLSYLPPATPLGLYGRGPNWLYAAVALHAAPAPFALFDVRLGWVFAHPLRIGPPAPAPLQIQLDLHADHVHWQARLPHTYLDYTQWEELLVPPLPAHLGLLLDGKWPHWLCASLARTYRAAPWIAVYQPQVGAVVVHSTDPTRPIGALLR